VERPGSASGPAFSMLYDFFSEPFLEGRVVGLFEGTRTITPAPPQLHSNYQRP
jgi:hypothetical protein